MYILQYDIFSVYGISYSMTHLAYFKKLQNHLHIHLFFSRTIYENSDYLLWLNNEILKIMETWHFTSC